MDPRLDPALKVAELLLQIKAVKLSPAKPFIWASGWKSSDLLRQSQTLSHPTVRTYIRQQFTQAIEREFGKPDMIAGVATGGIAHGMLVAQEMGLPFVYVQQRQGTRAEEPRGRRPSHRTQRGGGGRPRKHRLQQPERGARVARGRISR